MLEILVPAVATIIGAILGGLIPYLITTRRAKKTQAYKFVYIKIYHLRGKVPGNQPIYRKFIERLKKEIDVYDEFHYFKLSIFKAEISNFSIGDRTSGVVDMQILHPLQQLSFSDVEAQEKVDIIQQVIKKPSSAFFTRSMYYNGFQRGYERFAIKMDYDTNEARMIVDFTAINGFEEFIKGSPKGIIRREDKEEDIGISQTYPGMYVISRNNLEKGDVLRIDFDIEWDNHYLN